MESILQKIIRDRKENLEAVKKALPLLELKQQAAELPPPPSNFKDAISAGSQGRVNIIAEVKKASPSKGIIKEDFKPLEIARQYESAGVAAVSVLTEENYFLGKPKYLHEISSHIHLPCLRKDFIIDPYQIYEARVLGASAFLLIVDCLSANQISEFIQLGKELSMVALVECHRREEVATALECNSEIIGINNRNLRTFETSLEVSFELCKDVPKSIPVISESGIKTREDMEALSHNGIRAALIGETFMRYPEKIRELQINPLA